MQTISERIDFIINSECGGKATSFAERLGINSANVSMWRSGKSKPSSQTIRQICDTFGYDIDWLSTGEGEPILQKSRSDQLAAALGRALRRQDSASTRLIGSIALVLEKLDDDQIAAVLQAMTDIVNSYNANESTPAETKKMAAARSGDRVEVFSISAEEEESALPPFYSGDI